MAASGKASLAFIICIKPDPIVTQRVLAAQLASCLAIDGAEVLIGLSHADPRIAGFAEPFLVSGRVRLEVLDDRSLYDGWNKAVDRCSASAISFLGYGDCIANPAYYEALELDGADACFARVVVTGPDRDRLMGRPFTRRIHYWRQQVAFIGAVFSRALLLRHRFDPEFRIVGDYEFLLRAGRDLNSRFTPLIAATMPAGGLSEGNHDRLMAEVRKARAKFGAR